jgi:cytochrome c oxidase cbb3-type subunit II
MFNLHYRLERKTIGLVLGIIVVAAIGGAVEIIPLFTIHQTVEEAPDMRVYTPLEIAGRNIYLREGCYACHSQMIRTLRDEVERYGPYSLAVESKYDHPSSGDRSGPGRTSRASATNIRTNGMSGTSTTRGRSCLNR